ncbi:MAG TPA: trypsin-like peptidase domain-containing protein [Syntrophobacteria bacterium]|nr:trypsin-like peptidase domain-containing protein [Syntrophobacteria bacterium]
MSWNDAPSLVNKLSAAAKAFDTQSTAAACEELINRLRATDEAFPAFEAKECLRVLRSQRFFAQMQRLAEALIETGQDSHQIRRQHAQALLDQGSAMTAIPLLERLITDTVGNPHENGEARGLLGRAYKQAYVDGRGAKTDRSRRALQEAIQQYYGVYQGDPAQLWHGINSVALLMRAERDGVSVSGFPDPKGIATAILHRIEGMEEPTMWDVATAAEACVALGRPDEALRWASRYVRAPGTNAFELASTHRQMTEVWQLDMNGPIGRLLLPLLRGRLLEQSGSHVELPTEDLAAGSISAAGRALEYEAILGDTGVVTLNWYRQGLERCRAVGRIETQTETERGFGTGFLIRGKDLHPSLGEGFLLLTNAHVISRSVSGALRPEEAWISFKALADGSTARNQVRRLIWESPPDNLDATLIELSTPVVGVEPYPLARNRPLRDGSARVYVIGHPEGGTLAFSINDNRVLDYDEHYLHYRAPTAPGSSGSPVFSSKGWQLLALHHAGGTDVPRLNRQPGRYAANEGIWIDAIGQAIAAAL